MYKDHYLIVYITRVEINTIINSLKGRFRALLDTKEGYFIFVMINYPGGEEIIKVEAWMIKNKLMVLCKIIENIVANCEIFKLVVKYIINKLFDFKIIDKVQDNEIYKEGRYFYFATFIKLIDTEDFIKELENTN